MKVLRLDSSIRGSGSSSRAIADLAEQRLAEANSTTTFARRDLGANPLPGLWSDAMKAQATPNVAGYLASDGPPSGSTEQVAGVELARTLTDELVEADAYLFTVPMYNLFAPQQFKLWLDLIIVDQRAADVSVPILSGKPALVVVSKGGAYGPGTPREGSDFLVPWLRAFLGSTWGLDLTIVDLELTMAEHNPAMSELVPLAQTMLATCQQQALTWASAVCASNSMQ